MRLVARMREELAAELSLRDLFDTPTVSALAERIEALRTIRALKNPPHSQANVEVEEGCCEPGVPATAVPGRCDTAAGEARS